MEAKRYLEMECLAHNAQTADSTESTMQSIMNSSSSENTSYQSIEDSNTYTSTYTDTSDETETETVTVASTSETESYISESSSQSSSQSMNQSEPSMNQTQNNSTGEVEEPSSILNGTITPVVNDVWNCTGNFSSEFDWTDPVINMTTYSGSDIKKIYFLVVCPFFGGIGACQDYEIKINQTSKLIRDTSLPQDIRIQASQFYDWLNEFCVDQKSF